MERVLPCDAVWEHTSAKLPMFSTSMLMELVWVFGFVESKFQKIYMFTSKLIECKEQLLSCPYNIWKNVGYHRKPWLEASDPSTTWASWKVDVFILPATICCVCSCGCIGVQHFAASRAVAVLTQVYGSGMYVFGGWNGHDTLDHLDSLTQPQKEKHVSFRIRLGSSKMLCFACIAPTLLHNQPSQFPNSHKSILPGHPWSLRLWDCTTF